MGVDIAKLEKILRLEAADNYKDQKVYRGLSAFISNWTRESLAAQPTPPEARLVELVADQLIEYNAMTLWQRAKAIQGVLDATAEVKRGQGPGTRDQELGARGQGSGVRGQDEASRGQRSEVRGQVTAPVTAAPVIENRQSLNGGKSPLAERGKIENPTARRLPPRTVSAEAPQSPAKPVKSAPAAITDSSFIAPVSDNLEPIQNSKLKTQNSPDLSVPLTSVKGIGETWAKLLSYVGLRTVHDALYYFPFRHEDFSSFKKINALMFNQTESVIAEVVNTTYIRTSRGKTIIQVTIADETGQLPCIFFNAQLTRALKTGTSFVFSGKVEQGPDGKICFKSPVFEQADKELLSTGRLVPVYSTVGPLKVSRLRQLIKKCVDQYAKYLPEHLPEEIRRRQHLSALAQAVQNYHLPPDQATKEQARRRLAFDEFFLIQLGVLLKRFEWREERPGVAIPIDRELLQAWFDALDFKVTRFEEKTGEPIVEMRKLELTGAQKRAIEDIMGDLAQPKPMNRLLQGDVGSGKTVVGASALLMAVASGFQGALMAPTQILAEQHYQGLRRLFDRFEESEAAQSRGIKIRLELLTGNIKKKDALYQRIRDGEVDIVVGTSAVIQELVTFNRLGLVIIDEQHRFGVVQRATLRGKGANSMTNAEGANPHLLVMTATPIPRTLNLTIYGDLDLSIMNEMPPGRLPIRTRWVQPHERQGAYNFIRKQIEKGRQAFVICPLVEESDKIEAKAAVEEHARLQRDVFPDLKLGLLHGKMKPADKDAIMHQFRDRAFDILVATSVIEVGIDIPNATVIMIEGAERFGLSQLHQFRGRVGRGQGQSYCLLLAGEELSADGKERLKAIENTNDGFVLAEIDLKMRGPGEFFGTRQSGVPDLRVAGVNDVELLEVARREASTLFEADPGLSDPAHRLLSQKVGQLWSFEGDRS